ncbi:MAG: glycosyl transferase, partial [Desertifilum sp. SIO1I2]|nr:glycosyl transferase [Desertifilum sp. SIO1I2]
MKLLNRWIAIALTLLLGCLLGLLGFFIWDKLPSPVQAVNWSPQAQWITSPTPNYRVYARRTVDLPGTVQAGWLRLSADNDFILYVNGEVVAQESSIPRNTAGLASRLSEPFQRIDDSLSYGGLVPDWIYVASPRDWKLTTYIDLTAYLRPGRNAIAIALQKSTPNPRLVVEGAIYPVQNAPIDLTTGATPWRTATLSENRQSLRWFDPNFTDIEWPLALALGPVREATYSRLSPHLFDRPLQGNWIKGQPSPLGEVWLRKNWQLSRTHQRGFIRFAGDGEFALTINGLLVQRYEADRAHELHLYEITNFLHPGRNTLAVRLAPRLDRQWDSAGGDFMSPTGSVRFFLDGWVETPKGEIIGTLSTHESWETLTEPVTGWTQGAGTGKPASLGRLVNPQEFQRHFEGNAYLLNYPNYLWHLSLWMLGGMLVCCIYAWGLGWLWLTQQPSLSASPLQMGSILLLPGTLFLVGVGLLKHRYAEAEPGLLFAQPQSHAAILLGFIVTVLLTLVSSAIVCGFGRGLRWSLWFLLGLMGCAALGVAFGANLLFLLPVVAAGVILAFCWRRVNGHSWPSWGHWAILGIIIAVGFGLRVYHIGFVDLEPDETTSYDAVRGILQTGAPISTSGIWYTRGPVYHYLLALWLILVGDSAENARLLSAIWGTATLGLIFVFTKKMTGKIWIALVVTALMAIDPWEIWYSRNIRFYQLAQFLNILAFWAFYKGFIDEANRRYQHLFFFALTLTLLTQEVTITLPPLFFLGFLYFYRPFQLKREWTVLLGLFLMMAIFAYNIAFVSLKSLTPLVGLSSMTTSFLKIHFSNLSVFAANFFVGFNRMYVLYSVFFFVGFGYALKKRDPNLLFLYSSTLINIVLVSILVFLIFTRYTYPIYPIFVMLAIYGAVNFAQSLGKGLSSIWQNPTTSQWVAGMAVSAILLLSLQPQEVLASYQEAITPRHTQVIEYIREHRQPGDVVISNIPAVHSVILGGVDYYIPHRMSFFDAVYLNEGKLIDRWQGGQVITNLDRLNQVLTDSPRV